MTETSTPTLDPAYTAPSSYTELWTDYMDFAVGVVLKAGIDHTDAEDVACDILARLFEIDILGIYNGELEFEVSGGKMRRTKWTTFFAGSISKYVMHYKDRQWTRRRKVLFSINETFDDGTEVGDQYLPHSYDSAETGALTADFASLRAHLEELPIRGTRDLPKLLAICENQMKVNGNIDRHEIARIFKVSLTAVSLMMGDLREVMRGQGLAPAAAQDPPPHALLLVGPHSTGKTTIARWWANDILQCQKADIVILPKLTAPIARQTIDTNRRTPMGKRRCTIINIDAADEALNILLKTLEEPDRFNHYALTTNRHPPLTVTSRCYAIRTGLLDPAALKNILISRKGISPDEAERLAALGHGTIDGALGASETAKNTVLTVLRAAADGNEDLVQAALKNWDAACEDMFRTWCVETVTQRHRTFLPTDGVELSLSATTFLKQLDGSNARPRIKASAMLLRKAADRR